MSDYGGKAGDSSHIEEIGTGQKPKPTFGTKLKRHYKRFWWLHLIFFICFTLIIVLCLIYLAYPHIAQQGITASTLTIQSLILSSPTLTTFHLTQTALITNNNTYHPHLDAFNASISLHSSSSSDDTPYAQITLPSIHATRTATSSVNQTVQITNLSAFNAYSAAVLGSESVELRVKGRTKLHEMRFPSTVVDYDKVVRMKGLNSLTGFSIPSFSIKLPPDPTDGTNLIGQIYIPNPSVMTLEMGNLTLTTHISNTTLSLGITHLTNLVLRPGNNTLPMRSTINQTLVVSSLLSGRYPDGVLPVDIGVQSVERGGVRLGYFEEALRGVRLGVRLDVGRALREVGVDVGGGGGGGGK
ncbi:MAG: hypothetical protein HETSPECPRED_001655 [Heterodermia speciosa]|uniref:Uncharacterized protein n=1 Tax=Heterodermia speciosa TaxID=116794 RepID=A0A8H3EYJ5_9LECA|nr:MAG: hypothetical protein HETSPECPRED_001655 [Heterodermia speciosa]